MTTTTERMNASNFVHKAKEVHGDKYDFSKAIYKGSQLALTIVCKVHGEFQRTPCTLVLKKSGCPTCAKKTNRRKAAADVKKLAAVVQGPRPLMDSNNFVKRAQEVHKGVLYDYSEAHFVSSTIKVKIICKIHGIFEQTPTHHVNDRTGCPGCPKRKIPAKLTTDEFIARATARHGNRYDYGRVVYKNVKTNIEILCKIHGVFHRTPEAHLNWGQEGGGCTACATETAQEEFIIKAKIVHGDVYDYSSVVYLGSQTKITIRCEVHGEFTMLANNHMQGRGCKHCNCKNFSRVAITWLEHVGKELNCKIQHALRGGEKELIIGGGRHKVDGFCAETNTVFQFNGSFYHGDPRSFDQKAMNTKVGKTYGELHEQTLALEVETREAGFNLIVMWEEDWLRYCKERSIQPRDCGDNHAFFDRNIRGEEERMAGQKAKSLDQTSIEALRTNAERA